MSYRLAADESLEEGLQRIADEQIGRALAELDDAELPPAKTVHQVRKRCKKLRGLLRLFRDALGDTYSFENGAVRDAARRLSSLRDARAKVESCRALADARGPGGGAELLAPLRASLERRAAAVEASPDTPEILRAVRAELDVIRARCASWRLERDGFGAVRGGLQRTLRRARHAFADARGKPGTERLHEWRKRVKYHGYHLRLLRNAWPAMMRARQDQTEDLGELLGDDHDVAVLTGTLREADLGLVDEASREALEVLLRHRRADLQRRALLLGARLHAERASRFVERVDAWWDVWREESRAQEQAEADEAEEADEAAE